MTTKTIKIGDILEEKSYIGSAFFVVLDIENKKGSITLFRVDNSKILPSWSLSDVRNRLTNQSFNSVASHRYKIHSGKTNKGQNKNEEQ